MLGLCISRTFFRSSSLKRTLDSILAARSKSKLSDQTLVSFSEDPDNKKAYVELNLQSDFRRVRSIIIAELQKQGYQEIEVKLASKTQQQNEQQSAASFGGRSAKGFDAKQNLHQIKNVIAVYGTRGGVGKTTISIALARILARLGYSVGLLDADIYAYPHPDIFGTNNVKLTLSEFQNHHQNPNNQLEPVAYSGSIKGMSYGYLVQGPTLCPGSRASQLISQLLYRTRWGTLDYLIVDMPPGKGDVMLTLCEQVKFNGAVLVGTPALLSIRDIFSGMAMFQEMRVKTLGIVQNFTTLTCTGCKTTDQIFGKSQLPVYRERYGITNIIQLDILKQPDQSVPELLTDFAKNIVKNSENVYSHPYVHYNTGTQKITIQEPASGRQRKQKKIKPLTLRTLCQCDNCYNIFTGRSVRNQALAIDPFVFPAQIKYRGQHSVEIDWSDGHRGSVYSFTRLWGDEVPQDTSSGSSSSSSSASASTSKGCSK